ncbi:hypothetical protein Pmar_PMAR012827 [Perkinsus marinus ATCC 50983]|uniref:Uncharacterized protein n=1 Tax=Perkinsus marinus (strain ATCC 50983 / TXsc) TaxID=423536 RepID=C5L5I4_PERM5|nr:hypothetical protein Pmar_PMAR012827 [Perkinsus marinus ATCC 50983]EER08009.1 hypothetical protein Pmar_PMAR012827 [Perkinsus marinus ATCC 50983]|eukprot:XP_002776193.1 hypothetical protein Pmar_PMAR012827 [Perkinsus marinus ATCC 50983]
MCIYSRTAEDSTMPKLVPSEMCIKLDACRKTRDFRKAQDLIQEERESIAKPFPAEDLTAALCAVDLIRSEYFVRIAKELFERGARDSRRRKEKDGLRGLWTKAVPGEVPH